MPDPVHPAFFCPACGQKHRVDLAPLAKRPGATLHTRCRGCDVELALQLDADGKPHCKVVGSPTVKPAPKPTPKPPVQPAPKPPAQPPQPAPADLEEGDRAGRYEIEALIRRGHTSVVYRAHDPETKRKVVLKVLQGDASEDARARFERRIEVQGRIRHPNVLPVYDRGTLPDGRPFFAAELLHEPRTLATLVHGVTHGEADVAGGLALLGDVDGLVKHVLLPIADGTYVANVETGQIHRDLRPENILVDSHSGRPYLDDFGYAAAPSDQKVTPAVPLSHFTPPETTEQRVNTRTDVWGLGALLYLIVSGAPPLTGRGRALLDAAQKGRFQDIPRDASPALAAIAKKALAPSPDDRYVNARQMAADLKAWSRGGTVRALDEYGGEAAQRVVTRAALARSGRMALWVLGGLLVGLLVGSRIRLQGNQVLSPTVAAASQDVDRLDRGISQLSDQAPFLDRDEVARTWAAIHQELRSAKERVALAPASDASRGVEARATYVESRLRVPSILARLPEGLTLVLDHQTLDETFRIEAGDKALSGLPPGLYEVRDEEGRFCFPFTLPLDVRRAGSPDEPAETLVLEIPETATAPPKGTVYVHGGTVQALSPPWADQSKTTRVPSFFLDEHRVSGVDWTIYLNSLSDEARAAVGDLPEGPPEPASAPVRVLGAQARAYVRWRAEHEHRNVRIPSEAAWALAAGGMLVDPLAGDLQTPLGAAPCGVTGMGDGPAEMTMGPENTLVVKGGHDQGASPSKQVYGRRPLADGEAATFRCARVGP